MLNTLVHNMPVHKGLQWALHNGTVVYVGEYKGTPCIHYLGPK